ncbi:hypothetical protein FRX31_013499 [Thalictrum thalictroides]|uniref:Uncharacterized protein n=1 Tax=Thalictrum thalictroides TaxID=46969 RepID=A0A7J6WHR0_THATH|nr:hypothetical protein FRX31_013499 [Thalictrum thalictroides]
MARHRYLALVLISRICNNYISQDLQDDDTTNESELWCIKGYCEGRSIDDNILMPQKFYIIWSKSSTR